MKALRDCIVVRPLKMDGITPGGIIVPQDKYKRYDSAVSIGQVILMGDLFPEREMYHEKDFDKKPLTPKVGDYILMAKYSGRQVSILDQELSICLPNDCLLILTEEEAMSVTSWSKKED